MPILREHAQRDNGRVTAGLPSLTSERRFELTEQQLHTLYQQGLVKEVIDNDESAARPKDGKRSMNNWDDQVGIPFEAERVIIRLRRLNRNLWFERGIGAPGHWGAYVLNPSAKGGRDYIGYAFRDGIVPENTVAITDEKGKHKELVHGWRFILMRLIRKGLISEPAAFRMFGPPSRESERWALFTQ